MRYFYSECYNSNSVSVIEPGPVATEFQATSVSSGGGFDLTTPTDDNPLGVIVNEDVDDMTREHFTKTIAGFAKRVKAQVIFCPFFFSFQKQETREGKKLSTFTPRYQYGTPQEILNMSRTAIVAISTIAN